MQAIIISALEMWPASVSTITTSNSPPPTTTTITPYRPFEELGFPSPEPPAPPPGELSPPLPGSQWTLSPPAEEQQRSSIETVRWYPFGWEVALVFLGHKLLRLGGKGNYIFGWNMLRAILTVVAEEAGPVLAPQKNETPFKAWATCRKYDR